MQKVTACAFLCTHFNRSLQNMSSGVQFEYGQRFTVNIWPLKAPTGISSVVSPARMHIWPKERQRWQRKPGTRDFKFKSWFFFFLDFTLVSEELCQSPWQIKLASVTPRRRFPHSLCHMQFVLSRQDVAARSLRVVVQMFETMVGAEDARPEWGGCFTVSLFYAY